MSKSINFAVFINLIIHYLHYKHLKIFFFKFFVVLHKFKIENCIKLSNVYKNVLLFFTTKRTNLSFIIRGSFDKFLEKKNVYIYIYIYI